MHLNGANNVAPYANIEFSSEPVGLDFDYEEHLIFFTTFSKSIVKSHFNGSLLKEIPMSCKLSILFHKKNRHDEK